MVYGAKLPAIGAVKGSNLQNVYVIFYDRVAEMALPITTTGTLGTSIRYSSFEKCFSYSIYVHNMYHNLVFYNKTI